MKEKQDATVNSKTETLLKHQTVKEVEKKLREKQKITHDKQVFDDVIAKIKVAEMSAKELKRSKKDKSDDREILQNDIRKDFDKEKPRVEIRNSEQQILTTDVLEYHQGQSGVRELNSSGEKRKITPEKEPSTYCINPLTAFFFIGNIKLDFSVNIF